MNSEKKIKILFYGDAPPVATGFGTVSRNILVPLAKTGKYDITVLGINYWGEPHTYPFDIWPVGVNSDRDPYGRARIQEFISQAEFDILFCVQDSFILGFLKEFLPNLRAANKKFKSVCFSGDTDIITREGIKNIKNVKIGDLALSFDTKTQKTVFKKVTDVFEVPFCGDMVNIKGESIDLCLTPDHKMYVQRRSNKHTGFEWTSAGEMMERANTVREYFPKFGPVEDSKKLDIDVFPLYQKIDDTTTEVLMVPVDTTNSAIRKTTSAGIFSGRTKKKYGGKEISVEYDPHIGGYHIPLKRFNSNRIDLLEFLSKHKSRAVLKSRKGDRSELPLTIPMGDFLKLSAWYITEGCCTYYVNPSGEKVLNEISIASNIEVGREVNYRGYIKRLLDCVGIRYREKKADFLLKGTSLVSLFKNYFGNGAGNKTFPDWFLDLDIKYLRIFFEELLKGGGDRDKKGYTTKSSLLAEKITLLAFMLGIKAHIKRHKGNNVYIITFTYPDSSKFRGSVCKGSFSRKPFDGKVYCVTVEDTHTVFAGRNGYFSMTGQCYFPIDGTPKTEWVEAMAEADFPVTYTEFGKKECIKAVPSIENKLQHVYHGVNLEDFYPMPYRDILNFRRKYFGPVADHFIYANINRNQQRKDIPRCMLAFRELKKKYPDIFLYLHMASTDQGWDLIKVAKSLGLVINRDIAFPQNFGPNRGYPIQVLNQLYNSCDAVISSTLGEGWGLSSVEAMATKTPIIFPDNTSLSEIIGKDRGLLVKSGHDLEHHTILPHDNEVLRPMCDVQDLIDKMEMLYKDEVLRLELAENAYKWVTENIVWDTHIAPWWDNLISKAAAELDGDSGGMVISGAMEV